jgi:hypothetical protein
MTLRKGVRVYRLDHSYRSMLLSVHESAGDLLARFAVRGQAGGAPPLMHH